MVCSICFHNKAEVFEVLIFFFCAEVKVTPMLAACLGGLAV